MEEKTKQAIIDATFILLERKDMNSISIREIAAKAGVNVATISYYFGGKAQLFAHLMELYWKDLITLCEEFSQLEVVTHKEAETFCKKFLQKEMSSTGIVRSEQIMFQNYEVDSNTKERLAIQFKAFRKLVTACNDTCKDETLLLAKIVALISALSQPAYWTDIATQFVGDLESFIDIYIRQLIEAL